MKKADSISSLPESAASPAASEDFSAVEDSKSSKKKKASASRRTESLFYRVTVRDNGSGMPHEDVPNMFGRVLAGTNYAVKQARGKFGLGAKMALIWSKV